MSSRARVLLLLVVALTVSMQVAVPAPALAADWGEVTTLAANSRGEAIVVDSHGTVTVVWATATTPSGVVALRRTAGHGWGDPVVIGHGYAPQVAVDRRGDVTAAWLTQAGGKTDGVAAARRPAGGGWSRPVHLSRDVRVPGYHPGAEDVYGATHLDLAASSRGAVAVAWAWGSQERGRPWRVQSVRRPRGGPWGDPVAVTPANWSSAPQVGVDAGGTTIVVWGRQPFGHPQTLRARQHEPGSGWTRPETIAAAGYAPDLAVDRAGDAVVAFSTASSRVAAAVMPAGGHWGAPRSLSPAGVDASDFALAMNGAGAAAVALGRSSGRVDLVELTPELTWTEPARVVRSEHAVYDVLLALDDAGDIFLGWGGYALYGKYRPQGAGWSSRSTISPDAGVDVLESTHAVVAPDGTVAVLWKQEARPLKVRLDDHEVHPQH